MTSSGSSNSMPQKCGAPAGGADRAAVSRIAASFKLRQWSFTILLLGAYLGIFNLWLWLSRGWILASGLLAAAVLTWVLLWVDRHGGFVSRLDRFLHTVVILDVFLEAFFQDHFGFYWCAAGFVACIAGYRFLRR